MPIVPAMNTINDARLRLNLSYREFADLIGVDRTTVQRWERGTVSPPGPALKLIQRIIEEHEAAS